MLFGLLLNSSQCWLLELGEQWDGAMKDCCWVGAGKQEISGSRQKTFSSNISPSLLLPWAEGGCRKGNGSTYHSLGEKWYPGPPAFLTADSIHSTKGVSIPTMLPASPHTCWRILAVFPRAEPPWGDEVSEAGTDRALRQGQCAGCPSRALT